LATPKVCGFAVPLPAVRENAVWKALATLQEPSEFSQGANWDSHLLFQNWDYFKSSSPVCFLYGKKYNCMWVIAVSNSIDRINMLEAAVISEFQQHVGCKNEPDTGGEGALNRKNRAKPPYYLYVTAGKADQARWVG
jgi:hypothetical protein